MTIVLPWPCVVALRLEPIGPIRAEVFGLRGISVVADEESWPDYSYALYDVAEPRRLSQLRDALGQFVHDPRVNQVPFNPERHPFYTLLCSVQTALQEGQ